MLPFPLDIMYVCSTACMYTLDDLARFSQGMSRFSYFKLIMFIVLYERVFEDDCYAYSNI